MAAHDGPPVGLLIGSAIPPEQIAPLARLGDELGYCELWIPEDYFFTGGFTGAAVALGATKRIPVGLGIVSAMVRHPAVTAMELATLSRAYPGRVWPGIGLGVPMWLDQMKLRPRSTLTPMRECVTTVRRLLAGEELTWQGDYFGFDRVKLTHPAQEELPIYMGIIGPKMCLLTGEIADGLIVGATASVAYLKWAREKVGEGAAAAGRGGAKMRFPCFVISSIGKDSKAAKEQVRPILAFYLWIVGKTAYTDTLGISEELEDMIARGGHEAITREMPDRWIDEMTIAGDPEEAAERIRHWTSNGADSVILFPMPIESSEEMVKLVARETFPRL